MTSPLMPTETRHDCPVCGREADTYTASALAAYETRPNCSLAPPAALLPVARKPTRRVERSAPRLTRSARPN